MLQIKTIPKNISTSTSWTFSFIYLTSFSEGLINLARKQLNVNTLTLQPFLAKNKQIYRPNNNNFNVAKIA